MMWPRRYATKDYERAMVVDAKVNEANRSTSRSERRSVLEKSVIEPTLSEISVLSDYQESSPRPCPSLLEP
jgi:hypothetical protein